MNTLNETLRQAERLRESVWTIRYINKEKTNYKDDESLLPFLKYMYVLMDKVHKFLFFNPDFTSRLSSLSIG